MDATRNEKKLIIFPLLIFYILLVMRNAWISDDAIITFRVVENFLAGYGLGYNPFVRVQAFTHPLWLFLISGTYFVTRWFVPHSPNALFYVAIFLSVLFSFLSLFLLFTRISQKGFLSPILATLILSLSVGFIDFSTSGLENALTHFLLAIFASVYLVDGSVLLLSFVSSLLMLNRMDAILLILPALVYRWWVSGQRKNITWNMLAGWMPVLFWEVFSLLYFGFPFPNTAYAKLNTGVSSSLLILQGLDYFLNSINWDPILLFAIVMTGIALYFERSRKLVALYIGVLLYLLYVVKIGGDFMSGRFLTAPLFLSVVILSAQITTRRIKSLSLLVVVLLGVFSLRSPLWASNIILYIPNYPISDPNGIADERLHYFGNDRKGQFNSFVENGFRNFQAGSDFAGNQWRFTGFDKVYVAEALGKPGYKKGPNTYVMDTFALSDPLLARLPVVDWDIGHFRRDLPEGYYETLVTGENKIADPDLALYYSKLNMVTAGKLWSSERLLEIWNLNTGKYNYLLEKYRSHIRP